MNVMKIKSLLNKQLLNSATKLTRATFASSTPTANGISFQITDEQKSFLELTEKFTREEIIPKAAQYDRSGICFKDALD